jgi:hypothetical protein
MPSILASLSPTLVASSRGATKWDDACMFIEESRQPASAFDPDVPRQIIGA